MDDNIRDLYEKAAKGLDKAQFSLIEL
jgi:hypothetical protein